MGGLTKTYKPAKLFPIGGSPNIEDYEARSYKEALASIGKGKVETAAIFDANGEPVVGVIGEKHNVGIPANYTEIDGGILTHLHPNDKFGGTLSMQDLRMFSNSKLGEIRATTKQGYTYSVKATAKSDRKGLNKWVKGHEKLYQKNFERSYDASLKRATTVLKSGPHKGKVKLPKESGKGYKYVNPMTPAKADAYARKYSVNSFDKAYKKALKRYGFDYKVTRVKQS